LSWSNEIKARIRRRYAQLAAAGDRAGAQRMRQHGYPEAVLREVPRELAANYSGCGFPLAGVSLTGVRHAVDLGCGAGSDAWWMASEMSQGGVVVALDMTTGMLHALRAARADPAASAIFPVAGDLEHIPLAREVADLVVANASFNLRRSGSSSPADDSPRAISSWTSLSRARSSRTLCRTSHHWAVW